MTLTELRARLKAVRTLHSETLPPPGPERIKWQAERELFQRLDELLLERLNEKREVRA